MKVLVALSLALTTSLLAQTPGPGVSSGKHPFTFEDMMKLKRVGAPVPSPDGKWVVFDAEDVDLEANTKISHLWIVPAQGGESRRLNPTPNHEERPRFSPDGKRLIWTSKATDPTQIWMCDFDPSAGALVGRPHQVTNISTGADGAIWSPNGMNIVFVSAVYPDCQDDACNKQRDDEQKKSKVKAKIFTRLFYRHWNAYTEFKRSHLFVVSADSSSTGILPVGTAGVSPAESLSVSSAASQTPDKMSGGPTGKMPVLHTSEPRDLTPGDHDVPPFHLGGQDMYAISPDGQEVAYTSNIESEAGPAFVEATSTNNEIFIVPMAGGNHQSGSDPKKISTSPGSDSPRSIRRTENTSPGARKPAPASKPINGGSCCMIDNRGRPWMSRKSLEDLSEASPGRLVQRRYSFRAKIMASHRFSCWVRRLGKQPSF